MKTWITAECLKLRRNEVEFSTAIFEPYLRFFASKFEHFVKVTVHLVELSGLYHTIKNPDSMFGFMLLLHFVASQDLFVSIVALRLEKVDNPFIDFKSPVM